MRDLFGCIRFLGVCSLILLVAGFKVQAQHKRHKLPEPTVTAVDFVKLAGDAGLSRDYYAQYRFEGPVRIQGVYPNGKFSKWKYDLVYSFDHASDYNPDYFVKDQYGIHFSREFSQSLIKYVIQRNGTRFYNRRDDEVDWELLIQLIRQGYKRLALGNIHVVGWEDELNEKVRDLKPGDVADLKGYLVDVRNVSKGEWLAKSSIALGLPDDYSKGVGHRDYFGCEIMWITDLEIYRSKVGKHIKHFGGMSIETEGMMDSLEVYFNERKQRESLKSSQSTKHKSTGATPDGRS